MISKDGVHHALECGQCVSHSKVHYFGLKEPFVGLEGGFVLILWLNEDVVVAFVYIY